MRNSSLDTGLNDKTCGLICPHTYFDTTTNSCLECGMISSLKDEYEICQNFYKENDYYTFHTKKPQIGLKKYSKKEREIEEYKNGLDLSTDQSVKSTDLSTINLHGSDTPKSSILSSFQEEKKSVSNGTFIIIDERFYINNLKNKFSYIKSKEYNHKESSFENFYSIYKTFILDIPGNEDCIIGDKFYLSNPKKIHYSEPCYIFSSGGESCKLSLTKSQIKETKLRNKEFLKEIYYKYKSYVEKCSSFISEDKKRNKSKSYIECFVLCILIHYYIFHTDSVGGGDSGAARDSAEGGDCGSGCAGSSDEIGKGEKTKEMILENCFGLKHSSKDAEKISFKKKKMKSHIFSLIDLFCVNEVTMQTHLNDIINFI